MIEKNQSYGVYNQFKIEEQSDFYIEEMLRNGYTIIKNVFDNNGVKSISDEIDRIELEIEGKYDLNLDEDVIRCPLVYSKIILEVATHNKILSLIKKILGENFVLLMQNAIINKPNKINFQTKWHRDLNYQHFTSSNTLAINFLVCINPFFVDGGCSFVLPGSHMFSEFPSNEYINKHETPLEAEAGSVIFMNAMTYHRAGKNITKNFIRRAINHVVGQPFIAQQISIPKLLMLNNNDLSSDPFLSKYLGYKWNTADDIKSWVDLRK